MNRLINRFALNKAVEILKQDDQLIRWDRRTGSYRLYDATCCEEYGYITYNDFHKLKFVEVDKADYGIKDCGIYYKLIVWGALWININF